MSSHCLIYIFIFCSLIYFTLPYPFEINLDDGVESGGNDERYMMDLEKGPIDQELIRVAREKNDTNENKGPPAGVKTAANGECPPGVCLTGTLQCMDPLVPYYSPVYNTCFTTTTEASLLPPGGGGENP